MINNSTRYTLSAMALALALTGWGCQPRTAEQPNGQTQTNQPGVPSDASRSENYALVPLKQDLQVAAPTSTTSTQPTSGNSYYEDFAQSKLNLALSEKHPTILYFMASWDAASKTYDPKIATWINGDIRNIRGFKVNFDNEAALKKAYNVTKVNTAIFIGTDGKEKMRLSGTLDEEKFRDAMTLIAQQ
ncbi:MAG: thioredoxin family protein [Patescibacteria group bacterium]